MAARRRRFLAIAALGCVLALVAAGCLAPRAAPKIVIFTVDDPRDRTVFDVDEASLEAQAPELLALYVEAQSAGFAAASFDGATYVRLIKAMMTYDPDPLGGVELHRFRGDLFTVGGGGAP